MKRRSFGPRSMRGSRKQVQHLQLRIRWFPNRRLQNRLAPTRLPQNRDPQNRRRRNIRPLHRLPQNREPPNRRLRNIRSLRRLPQNRDPPNRRQRNIRSLRRLPRNTHSVHRQPRKHQRRPTVAGNVPMRSWVSSKIAYVVADLSARRSKSSSRCHMLGCTVQRNRRILR